MPAPSRKMSTPLPPKAEIRKHFLKPGESPSFSQMMVLKFFPDRDYGLSMSGDWVAIQRRAEKLVQALLANKLAEPK